LAKQRKHVAGQAPKEVKIQLTSKQNIFIQSLADEVLFGGSAGGGKSYVQLVDALICANNYAGSKQLILRETFPELERSLIMTSLSLYPSDILSYNAGEHRWYHMNGSTIEFGYLESFADVSKYQSAEYDIIRIDEATHMDEDRITYMKSRIRGANDFPKQLKMSTNPGGTAHKFLKKRFKIGVQAPYEIFKEFVGTDENGIDRYISRCYIPSRVYDNVFLMEKDPNYITNLMQLPERERKALLDGSWDIFDDQAFPEFEYDVHVCSPFPIPSHWKRWRSCDNGYSDPFAWYWAAVDETGTVYVYREYTRDTKEPKVTYSEQAKKVTELSTYVELVNGREVEKQEKIMYTVVGHDAFASHVRDADGKTLIDYYAEGGVHGCIKAITDRRLRKATIIEYLKPFRDDNIGKTVAKVCIFNTCKKLIEIMPETLNDPKDAEKYAESDMDHWSDSFGYLLLSHHASKSKATTPEKSDMEKDKAKLWKQMRRGRF
jgi:phage terminase large subunit